MSLESGEEVRYSIFNDGLHELSKNIGKLLSRNYLPKVTWNIIYNFSYIN
jgi:hypothetical protein